MLGTNMMYFDFTCCDIMLQRSDADAAKWMENAVYKTIMKAWDMKRNKTKFSDLHSQQFVKICFDPMLPAVAKILLRFGLNYNGANPECTKEEKEQDITLSIKQFTIEIVRQLIRRLDNRKLYRVSLIVINLLIVVVEI